MKNYIQGVEKITVTAAGTAAVSGVPYFSHSDTVKGVAQNSAAVGEDVVVQTEGIFSLACKGSDDIGLGDALYWDASQSELTLTSTDNTLLGTAFTAAGTGVTSVQCLVTK